MERRHPPPLLLLPLLLSPCLAAGHTASAVRAHGRFGGCQLGFRPLPYALANSSCLPLWNATWGMRNSTVLYTCNNSGLHDVQHATRFGVVVYDWWADAPVPCFALALIPPPPSLSRPARPPTRQVERQSNLGECSPHV